MRSPRRHLLSPIAVEFDHILAPVLRFDETPVLYVYVWYKSKY